MNPYSEEGVSDARIITPIFVHAAVFSIVATRAVISPSPLNCWYATWNESDVHQMSAPAPSRVKVPFANDARPLTPTLPTSVFCHRGGSVDALATATLSKVTVASWLVS